MMRTCLIGLTIFLTGYFDRPILNLNITGLSIQLKESSSHTFIISRPHRLKPNQ